MISKGHPFCFASSAATADALHGGSPFLYPGPSRARFFRLLLLPLLVCLVGPSCQRGPRSRETEAGRMGNVRILEPRDQPRAFVFLFSDTAGWTAEHDRAAADLVELGAVVVGVDLHRYQEGLAASDDGCHYVVAEIEDMSERLQRELGFGHYTSPVLAGNGEGGTLVYAALAQAPAATIGGALSIDPADVLHTRVPLCEGAPARAVAGGGFRYEARKQLPGWWHVVNGSDAMQALAEASHATAVTLEGDLRFRVVSSLSQVLRERGKGRDALLDLPIVEVSASPAHDLMAVIYSGDGGWRDLDKQIGEFLAGQGVPVVGVDSLRYFWDEKTPEQMAMDLSVMLRQYASKWGTKHVILIGYSFGAGILPFAFNRLSEEDRERVVEVSLLGLEPRAPFEIHVSGWFRSGVPGNASPVLPELRRIDLSRVQCFYGEEEEETLCREQELARADVIRTTGGHHFDGDYQALARRILDGALRRVKESSDMASTPGAQGRTERGSLRKPTGHAIGAGGDE